MLELSPRFVAASLSKQRLPERESRNDVRIRENGCTSKSGFGPLVLTRRVVLMRFCVEPASIGHVIRQGDCRRECCARRDRQKKP